MPDDAWYCWLVLGVAYLTRCRRMVLVIAWWCVVYAGSVSFLMWFWVMLFWHRMVANDESGYSWCWLAPLGEIYFAVRYSAAWDHALRCRTVDSLGWWEEVNVGAEC